MPIRPRADRSTSGASRRTLKTAQQPQTVTFDKRDRQRVITDQHCWSDHRQDSKGTWWMPWHLESMKGVNDCDKPR